MAYAPLVLPELAANPNFQDVSAWLTAASSALVSAGNENLQELKDLSEYNFGFLGTSPVYSSVLWTAYTGDLGTAPVRPDIPQINLDTLIAQIQLLTPPALPTETFSYSDPGYGSVLRAEIADKLAFDLINGGYGIDTTDEIALFNRARDREAQLLSEGELTVARQAAATGFPLPQGALYKQLAVARSEYVAKNSSVNRDIALKRADLYVQNRRQVIEQATQHEAQSIALYNAMQNRLLDAAKAEVQMAVFLYDAGIRLFQSRLDALTKQIDSNLAMSQAIVGIYNADVQAYAATVNSIVQRAQIDIKNSELVLEKDLRVYQSNVQVLTERLKELTLTVENRKDIARFLTEFFRTALGSAMNGINGLAVQTGDAPAAT